MERLASNQGQLFYCFRLEEMRLAGPPLSRDRCRPRPVLGSWRTGALLPAARLIRLPALVAWPRHRNGSRSSASGLDCSFFNVCRG
jgi:hypothetical protein